VTEFPGATASKLQQHEAKHTATRANQREGTLDVYEDHDGVEFITCDHSNFILITVTQNSDQWSSRENILRGM
jgi:hypothetical protein